MSPSFATSSFVLAAALLTNTLLGPLGTETIRYPITGTLLSQLVGLEVVTVVLVVPLLLLAGVLALRGHGAAPLLGFGPAAYSAYMFAQYVLGPEYERFTGAVLFHTVVFTSSLGLAVRAWSLANRQVLPSLSPLRRRVSGTILLLLAGFILTRYLPVVSGDAMPSEFTEARTFFWSIFLLDLGVVVPATLAAGVGLLRGARSAHPALYGLMGWYALVPPSVAAMSAAMVVDDDPHASVGQAVTLCVAAAVMVALAVWVFRPVLRSDPSATTP